MCQTGAIRATYGGITGILQTVAPLFLRLHRDFTLGLHMTTTNQIPLVGFIGAGNMARSLAGGLQRNGWGRERLILADPVGEQRRAIEQSLGLEAFADNAEVARRADILVLAVKPQVLGEVATGLAPAVQQKRPLVISIVAGVRIADISRWLGGGLAVVRAMPNTPALVGSGASGLYANPQVTDAQRAQAESILRAVGITVWVDDEQLIDVVTALSGSGPAYFFLILEALEQAAIRAGLKPDQARLLTIETAVGAAKMALEGGEEPALLRKRVTSPGGTTERAINVMEQAGLRKIFDDAVKAATQRARELGDLFGKNP
jgi:pyrroline-5-carboxylate reductase